MPTGTSKVAGGGRRRRALDRFTKRGSSLGSGRKRRTDPHQLDQAVAMPRNVPLVIKSGMMAQWELNPIRYRMKVWPDIQPDPSVLEGCQLSAVAARGADEAVTVC